MEYAGGHNVEIKDRKSIKLTGLKHVDSYDDKEVALQTSLGLLIIKGSQLNIKTLNLGDGILQVEGLIQSISYSDAAGTKRKNLIQRILK